MFNSSLKTRSKYDQYISKGFVGKGSFGQVERCEHKETSKIYAVKSVEVNALFIDSIQEEANLMLKAKSEYVLELIDHFYDEKNSSYILVTPFCKNGSFDTIMQNQWDLDQLMLFFYQMAKGLYDLEKQTILHLDLKPENILIKGPGQYLLCDFGCSRKLDPNNHSLSRSINCLKMTSVNSRGGGTTEYASPDLTQNGQMTPFTDIWSLGVILYKVIFNRHPLYKIIGNLDKNTRDFFNGTYQIGFTQTQKSAKFKPIVELLKRMLVCSKDKKKRITWSQLLDQIYNIQKISSPSSVFIITNFDILLQFVDKLSILTSALIYYYQQIQQNGISIRFDLRLLIKHICIFMLTFTKELVMHTKENSYEEAQFYLFTSTKKKLTKKQISFAQCLQKQALGLANLHDVAIEYGVNQICRKLIVADTGNLYKILRQVNKPSNLITQIQLKKLTSITNFIAYKNQLAFQNRIELVSFVKQLINS